MKLLVNGSAAEVDVPDDTPLLCVLREELGLTGTKYGCGKALCGACTVLVDGAARRSCVRAAADVAGRAITTTEGRAGGGAPHAVQQARIEGNAPRCGYSPSGRMVCA